jgi:pimeloyl-ACP methyl ester carboxylesterase
MHGILPPQAPVMLPQGDLWDSFVQVRDQLGAMGFAVAYSTYSENGLALKDAAQRTHQLRGLFVSRFGQPSHFYLFGHSLGALASLQLAERYPKQYDGIVPACGITGGTQAQLDYIVNVRALFDYFYPGVLPGDAANVPEGFVPTQAQVAALVMPAVMANPLGLFAIASTAQTPLAFVPGNVTVAGPSQTTLVTSLIVQLWYQLIGTPDVTERTHGHTPYDNSTVTYTLGTPVVPPLAPLLTTLIAGANAGVDRFTSPPDAQNLLARYYVPTGDLQIPVITVHNLWDYLVPYFHEPAFAQIVQAAGASDMLLQRAVPDYGHCSNEAFRNAVVQSFGDLVTWVSTGEKPAH